MTTQGPQPLPHEKRDGVAPRTTFTNRWAVVWGGALFALALLIRFGASQAFPHSSAAEGAAALFAAVLSFAGYLVITRRVEHDAGMGLRGPKKASELALGVLVGIVASAAAVGAIAAAGGYDVHGLNRSPEIIMPALAGVSAAIVEETFFRGLVQRLLDERLGSWGALAITAVFFGLLHGANPGLGLWGAVAITIQAGVLLGAAFLVTRRLWIAMGIHWAWNFLQGGIFSYPTNGEARHGLLDATTSGSQWLTGGNAGLEGAVLPLILNLAIAGGLMWIAFKRGNIRPAPRRTR